MINSAYINGVRLDNPLMGWKVLRETSRNADISVARSGFTPSQTHGITRSRGFFTPPAFQIVIGCRNSKVNALVALVSQPVLIHSKNSRDTVIELNGIVNGAPVSIGEDPLVQITLTFSVPEVWARSAVETITNHSSNGNSSFLIFPDISGYINDAQFILSGSNVSNIKLEDRGNGTSWRLKPTLNGYIRFDSATGKTYQVGSNSAWSGGTLLLPEQTVLPPTIGNAFELSPVFESGQPFARLRATGSAPFSLSVKGRNAYYF